MTPLEQLQDAVSDRLQVLSWFNGSASANGIAVPVLSENLCDINYQIDLAIEQLGIVLIIVTPTFELIDPELNPPTTAGTAMIAVRIFENVTLNRNGGTGVTALAAAQAAVNGLHFWPHGLPSSIEPIGRVLAAKHPIELQQEEPLLQYRVNFSARLQLMSPSTI